MLFRRLVDLGLLPEEPLGEAGPDQSSRVVRFGTLLSNRDRYGVWCAHVHAQLQHALCGEGCTLRHTFCQWSRAKHSRLGDSNRAHTHTDTAATQTSTVSMPAELSMYIMTSVRN